MPYVSPAAIVSGTAISKTTFGDVVKADLDYLANPPACRAFNNAAVSIPNNVATAVGLNSERFDTNTMHDTVTNNSRITFNTAGLYVVSASITWAVGVSSARALFIQLNGLTSLGSQSQLNVNAAIDQTVTTIYKFAVADYVQMMAFQNTGGALNVSASGNFSPELSATWIGLG